MNDKPDLSRQGQRLAASLCANLRNAGARLVLAESCTAGLVAATLGMVPGVSEVFCGSSVTYRSATKTQWLGVDAQWIANRGAVDADITAAMAAGVLEGTDEATIAVAVTGHFGPHAPRGLDGRVFACLRERASDPAGGPRSQSYQWKLSAETRTRRQLEATVLVLTALNDWLQSKV